MPEPLFLNDNSPILIGIAFYPPENVTRWPPLWKFIYGRKGYNCTHVSAATIKQAQQPDSHPVDWPWSFHFDRGSIGEPLAVVHIGEIPWRRSRFQCFIQNITADKGKDIPGQPIHVWSSSAWVIKALYNLELEHGEELGFKLPIRARYLFERIWPYLKRQRNNQIPRLPGQYPPAVRLEEL